jgi:hypothetical protein
MGAIETWRRPPLWTLGLVAGLSVTAYLWAINIPLISDSYVQIRLARDYGPVSGWASLASDVLYRSRASSLVLTYWTERWFGLDVAAFKWTTVVLHILNAWLVCWLGRWRVIGWRVSLVAACFFAFSHQHQEAVVWYAALPELLVFLFAVATLLFWLAWLQAPARRWPRYAAAFACFVLALLSKESAVVVVPLVALAAWTERPDWRRALPWIVPFGAMAALYFAGIYAARASHLHFNDAGTFTLGWHFVPVLVRSTLRLFWFWGFICLAALAAWRDGRWNKLLAVAAVWILITLLPYSFLIYMPFVPSRHIYFASVGLAFVIAAAWLSFRERFQARPWAVAALSAALLLHHCVYLWTRKQQQYVERAQPTEAVVHCARGRKGTVYVRCFPYDISVAQFAVEMWVGRDIQVVPASTDAQPERDPLIDLCASRTGPCTPPSGA